MAIDIRDAFHNVPSGPDRAYTAAAFKHRDGTDKILCYDVLVFGSVSSPSIWRRYASFLGRSLAAVVPEVRAQIYVDDPLLTFNLVHLAVALLWMGGFVTP